MAELGFDTGAEGAEQQDGHRVSYQIGNKDYSGSAALRRDPAFTTPYAQPSDLVAPEDGSSDASHPGT